MDRPFLLRNIVVTLALAYVLSAAALVATGPAALCRPSGGDALRLTAERARKTGDDLRAARSYVSATSAVLGCRTPHASLTAADSLKDAGTAYLHNKYEQERGRLADERTQMVAFSSGLLRGRAFVNPVVAMYNGINVAFDAAIQTATRP